MELSDKIRILRKARNFSQEQLGNQLSIINQGISRQSVSDWENGKSEPRLDNIRDLAKVLHVTFDALLDDSLDLNDVEILNNVLKNITAVKNTVNTKTRYRINQKSYPTLSRKGYILFGTFLFIGIVSTILYVLETKGFIHYGLVASFTNALGIVCYLYAIILFIRIILLATKGKETGIGEINNTHLIIYAKGNADNVIYIPLEKIESINALSDRKNSDVEIHLIGKNKPITIHKMIKSREFIKIYSKLIGSIESQDRVQII